MSAVRPFRRPLAPATLLAVPALVLATLGGAAAGQTDDRDAELASRRAQLDERYAFGPTAARSIGYRIVWQATIDAPVARLSMLGDDIYALLPSGGIARVEGATGNLIWFNEVVDRNHRVWGILEGLTAGPLAWGQNAEDSVCVVCDTTVTHVDLATGAVVRRDPIGKAPSSEVVRVGKHLVYGTHLGQVVWFNLGVGFEWRATQLWGPVVTRPVISGDLVGAVSSIGNETRKIKARNGDRSMIWGPDDDTPERRAAVEEAWQHVNPERGNYVERDRQTSIGMRGGSIGVLSATTARVVWGFGDKLFEGVVAAPAIGDGTLFCAGLDQYLWAFDADNGELRWKYLAPAPLTTSPVYVSIQTSDDRTVNLVLQWIEGVGLVAFDAAPGDTVEAKKAWTCPGARGTGVGMIGDRVVLWDAADHTLRLVDVAMGAVVKTVSLPQVVDLQMIGDSILAVGDDGRIVRLDPAR